jgi:GAF domain-containing protein
MMEDKVRKYEELASQIESLIAGERNEVSVLANVSAAIHEQMGFFWVGFYLVKGERLELGPFQGSVACYRIPYGKGVCGSAWAERRTLLVPDVEAFPDHIACSSLSRSEIVVPLWTRDADGKASVWGVLDIDSTELSTFDETDRVWLEKICELVSQCLKG